MQRANPGQGPHSFLRWLSHRRLCGASRDGRYAGPTAYVSPLDLVLFVAAIVSTTTLWASFTFYLTPPDLYWRDIVQDWLWARALREGLPPYDPTPTLALTLLGDCCPVHLLHPSPHPPLAGLLLLPLSWLEIEVASLLWAGVELGCLGMAIALLTRQPWVRVIAWTGLLLGWHALRTEIVHGQFTTLQLLLLVLAYQRLHPNNARPSDRPREPADGTGAPYSVRPHLREVSAGLLVGLAFCVKPILFPVVGLLIVQGQRWVLAGIAGATALVGSLSLLLIGLEGLQSYIAQLPATGQMYRDHGLNLSVWTVGWKLFPDDPDLASNLSLGLGLAILTGMMTWLWQSRRHPLALGSAVALSTVTSPVAWDIYGILLLLPAYLLWEWLGVRRTHRSTQAALGVVGAALLVPPLPGVHVALPLLSMAAFLGVAVLTLSAGRRGEERERLAAGRVG